MRNIALILPILVFINSNLHGQDRETLQSDSIYKLNRVKSRIQYWQNQPSKAKQITYYDTLGRLTDYMLTDNETGNSYNQLHIAYHYDKIGRESGYTSYFEDSTVEKVVYHFNKQGKVVKRVHTIEGLLCQDEEITYNPWIETSTFFDEKGNVVQKDTAYYENNNVYHKYSGFAIRNGKRSNWNYSYKATYDNLGRLVNLNLENSEYYYNEQGLLNKKISGSPQARLVTVFDYTYW